MKPLQCALLLLVSACQPEPTDTGGNTATRKGVRATRVTTSTADVLLLGGDRADGDSGHYAIYNGELSAVIDAAGFHEDIGIPEQHHRAPTGGTLLDLAPVGARDGLRQILHVINYDPDIRVYYQVVSVAEDGRALEAMGRILDPDRTLGVAIDEDDLVEQIVVTTTWRMWDRQPWLEVETSVTNQTGRGVDLGPVCDLVVTDGSGLDVFVPAPGVGFDLEERQRMLAPWVAFSGSPSALGSYGVVSLSDDHVFVQSDIDDDGRTRGVMIGPRSAIKNDLAPGEQRVWSRRYTASPGMDLAGVTQNLLELLGAQSGSFHLQLGLSDAAAVYLDVEPVRAASAIFERREPARFVDQEGKLQDGGVMPISAAFADGSEESVNTWLPPGTYDVQIDAPGYQGGAIELSVQAGLEQYGVLTLGSGDLAPLEVELTLGGGTPNDAPVRLTVVGLGGTEDPQLGRFALTGGELAGGNRIWTQASSLDLELPNGTYRLLASRGPLAPLAAVDVILPGTSEVQLVLEDTVVDGGGWISLDPFTASESSVFGGSAAEDVAKALCAEGVDMVVRAEAGGGESSIQGCDAQQAVGGVLGTLDVPRTGAARGDGWYVAFPVGSRVLGPGLLPGSWLDLAWDAGAQVTAILAPRAQGAAGAASGVFEARGFQRDSIDNSDTNRFLRETSEAGTNVMDATALEVLTPRDPWHTQNLVQDWFALLEGGYRLIPLASSHGSWLEFDNPGAARTMLLSEGDTVDERIAAIAEGQVYVTSGPLLDVTVRGPRGTARPGQALDVLAGEEIEVELRLRAADWVPVDRLRVIMDGAEVWSADLDSEGATEFSEDMVVEMGEESWLVVDAGRPEDQPEGDYSLVYPDMPIYAVTAPVWFD